MSHFITRCIKCQQVVAQCRCPSPSKEQRWVDGCMFCIGRVGPAVAAPVAPAAKRPTREEVDAAVTLEAPSGGSRIQTLSREVRALRGELAAAEDEARASMLASEGWQQRSAEAMAKLREELAAEKRAHADTTVKLMRLTGELERLRAVHSCGLGPNPCGGCCECLQAQYPKASALPIDEQYEARVDEAIALRKELAAEEYRADYVLNELANEHALPRYSTEAVDALVIGLERFTDADSFGERVETSKAVCDALAAVRASREPPR